MGMIRVKAKKNLWYGPPSDDPDKPAKFHKLWKDGEIFTIREEDFSDFYVPIMGDKGVIHAHKGSMVRIDADGNEIDAQGNRLDRFGKPMKAPAPEPLVAIGDDSRKRGR